jgi:hypothetical protein
MREKIRNYKCEMDLRMSNEIALVCAVNISGYLSWQAQFGHP